MPLSTDEINRWDEALRQATGSARQLATALEGIKQSAGSVTEGLSSVTAVNRELASGLQNVQNSAGQAGTEISAIGSHHSELTTLFVENGKKQQESLTQIAENTKKTTKTIGEEAAKSTGNITKEFVALSQMLGADGDGPFMQLATNFSAAALSVGTLGEEFKKLHTAQGASKAIEATGGNAKRLGSRTKSASEGTAALTGALSVGALAFGPWGAAAAAAIAIGGTMIGHFQRAAAEAEELKEAIKLENGLGENSIAMLAEKMTEDDLPAILERANVSTRTFTQALAGNGEASRELSDIQKENSERLIEIGEILDNTIDLSSEHRKELQDEQHSLIDKAGALSELTGLQGEYSETLQEGTAKGKEHHELVEGLTEATNEHSAATGTLASEHAEMTRELEDSRKAADDLRRSLDGLTGGTVDAMRAEADYHDSVRSATEAIRTNRGETDRSTESGSRLFREMEGLRDSTYDYMISQYQQTGSTEELMKAYEKQRGELIDLMSQYDMTEDEAAEYVDTIMGTPSEIKTAILAEGNGSWNVSAPGGYLAFASGGAVVGAGTGTSDDIPAMLSNGEHVLTAREVRQAGGQAGVYRLRSAIRQGYVAFAGGGAVGDRDPQRFARGGAVRSRAAQAVSDHTEETRVGIQTLHQSVIQGIGDYFGSLFKRIFDSGGPVVAAARSQLGVPYSWGGGGVHGPSLGFGKGAGVRGFDCSSLMQYAWWQGAGVRLPRVTYDQINTGRAVRKGSEVPGDLVFPHRGHVAMVAGPGRLIHTPYTGASVSYRSMYPSPIAIRRPSRFDTGGIWGSGTVGVNESGRPERVLSPRQTRAFEHLVDGVLSGHRTPVASVGRGSTADRPLVGTVNVNHVPGYSTPRDVVRALDHARRTARLARPR